MPKKIKEELQNGEVVIHKANKVQKILHKHWIEMVKKVGKVDAVFNLGDNVDGSNWKNMSLGLWTPSVVLQARAAADLLSEINCEEHYMVHGSKYHVGGNVHSEEYTAMLLENIYGIDVTHGKELLVDLGDKKHEHKAHLLHKIGVSRSNWNYRPTAISRELALAPYNKKELGNVQVVIRGHAHYSVMVRFPTLLGFVVPSWKLRDDFIADLGLSGVPRLGWDLMEVYTPEDDGVEKVQVNVTIHEVEDKKIKYMKECKIE